MALNKLGLILFGLILGVGLLLSRQPEATFANSHGSQLLASQSVATLAGNGLSAGPVVAQTGVDCDAATEPPGETSARELQEQQSGTEAQDCHTTVAPQPTPAVTRCPSGAVVVTGQPCPTALQLITCPNGGFTVPGQACPVTTQFCPNGTVVLAGQSCPPTTQTCPNGSVILIGQSCPPATQTCSNGSVIPVTQTCPPATQTCSNGSVIPVTQTCPPATHACSNGTVLPVSEACPAPPSPSPVRTAAPPPPPPPAPATVAPRVATAAPPPPPAPAPRPTPAPPVVVSVPPPSVTGAVITNGRAQVAPAATTSITVHFVVHNPLNERIDYPFQVNPGDPNAIIRGIRPGMGSVSGTSVTFSLQGGQDNPVDVDIDVTPTTSQAGGTITVVGSTHTTGVTASGGIVDVIGGAVEVPVGSAPAVPAVRPAAAVAVVSAPGAAATAPAPAPVAAPPAMPNAGTGGLLGLQSSPSVWTPLGLLGALGCFVAGLWLLRSRRAAMLPLALAPTVPVSALAAAPSALAALPKDGAAGSLGVRSSAVLWTPVAMLGGLGCLVVGFWLLRSRRDDDA